MTTARVHPGGWQSETPIIIGAVTSPRKAQSPSVQHHEFGPAELDDDDFDECEMVQGSRDVARGSAAKYTLGGDQCDKIEDTSTKGRECKTETKTGSEAGSRPASSRPKTSKKTVTDVVKYEEKSEEPISMFRDKQTPPGAMIFNEGMI